MKGLYKKENNQLVFAANAIYFPDVTVVQVKKHIEKPEQTEIIEGWHVFYSRQAALDFFGISEVVPDLPIPQGSNT